MVQVVGMVIMKLGQGIGCKYGNFEVRVGYRIGCRYDNNVVKVGYRLQVW